MNITKRVYNLNPYLRLLRFESWVGWLFNFALGSILFEIPPVGRLLMFSLVFILSTVAIFVLNQYFDCEDDKLNVLKRDLPVSTGDISAKKAIRIFFFLSALSIFLVFLTDVSILPLVLVYLALWISYSAPPLRLKNKPVMDVIVAGVGSGVLPFIIGLQVTQQLTLDFSSVWIMRHYQDAFFSVIPLLLFNSASHIFQTVGDYEADLRGNVHTFAVKYGKETSVNVGKLLLLFSALLPIAYWFLNLSLVGFFFWYLLILICCAPGIFYAMHKLQNPSTDNIAVLRNFSSKVSAPMFCLIWIYVLIVKLSL